MIFLSAILCLPFSHNQEALIIWQLSFTFSPTSIHLLFIPFTHFCTISRHILYSLVCCSTQMFNPIFSSLYLSFAFLHQEAGRIWKCSLPLSSPHSPFFSFQTVGCIKHYDIFWKYHRVSFSDLSELFYLLNPLWTSSRTSVAGDTSHVALTRDRTNLNQYWYWIPLISDSTIHVPIQSLDSPHGANLSGAGRREC